MRIFTVVFFYIIKEKKKCYFNNSTGKINLINKYSRDFYQYT